MNSLRERKRIPHCHTELSRKYFPNDQHFRSSSRHVRSSSFEHPFTIIRQSNWVKGKRTKRFSVKCFLFHKTQGSLRGICNLEEIEIRFTPRVRRILGEGWEKIFGRATYRLGMQNSGDTSAEARLLNFFSTPNAMQLQQCTM